MNKRPKPFVSVIIPTRNEGKHIGACLRSLLRGQYPRDRWEIIVADGMSNDDTRQEVLRVAQETPVPIYLLENVRRVTPIALNLAIGKARGEIIIRVDAHAEFGNDYVARCVQVLRESGADNVGGPVTTRAGADTPMAHAIAAAMAHPFGVGNSAFRTSRVAREVDTVPFGCFNASDFERYGLFDERLWRNQDYDMNQRIRRFHGCIYMDPRLESVYISRPTLQTLLRQAWENGFWNAMTHYLHPASFCLRHAFPMLFTLGVLFALCTAVDATCGHMPGWLLPFAAFSWCCVLLYGVLTLWVATRQARSLGWQLWPCLLLIFPTFHFTYGGGIAWGWINALLHRYPWQPGDGIPTLAQYRGDNVTIISA
jgi:glycosyltransferase involved in cell wall biosynthesis